jgi:hypothetical protein
MSPSGRFFRLCAKAAIMAARGFDSGVASNCGAGSSSHSNRKNASIDSFPKPYFDRLRRFLDDPRTVCPTAVGSPQSLPHRHEIGGGRSDLLDLLCAGADHAPPCRNGRQVSDGGSGLASRAAAIKSSPSAPLGASSVSLPQGEPSTDLSRLIRARQSRLPRGSEQM